MTSESDRRDSRSVEREVITDPLARAKAEIDNGLHQYDAAVAMAVDAIERKSFKLRPSAILALQREALKGISRYAGNYRTGPVIINKSSHIPPDAHLVPFLVEEMCDHVNDQFGKRAPLYLAAYVMWRLNWIHPFEDGNGRTSRMVSFVVMSASLGQMPAGVPTIADQIVRSRRAYYEAIEDADAKEKEGRIDVSQMEELLDAMLSRQLANYRRAAIGQTPE